MRVNVGDIVIAKYTTFEGKQATGLFVVVYHECHDNSVSNNITCIKISSTEYLYSVTLDPTFITCLDHISYANCNQQFRFIEPQITRILGRINSYIVLALRNQIYGYTQNIVRQLESHFTNIQPAQKIRHLVN